MWAIESFEHLLLSFLTRTPQHQPDQHSLKRQPYHVINGRIQNTAQLYIFDRMIQIGREDDE